MDSVMPPDHSRKPVPYYPAPRSQDQPVKQQRSDPPDTWDQEANSKGGRKKNYQRYPKPPYSYLAMIAMVIQNSPEKKLTLSQILKEISTLFPFFKGNYKGWRDSVRHNLSSYDCFVKVLKDPGKPQGKGNFWAVELSRVPLELLKRQNTAVSRQDETIFAQDLAPYILHGQAHKLEEDPSLPLPPPAAAPACDPAPPEDPYRPKLDSSFAIDSLLHSLRPVSAAGEGERARDSWGEHPFPQTNPRPRAELSPLPHPRYSSSFARRASASSASPASSSSSSSSDEDWRGVLPRQEGKRGAPGEPGMGGYEDCRPPPHKTSRRITAPPWELPTSYAKYAPPNVVAPPSMRFNGGPSFLPLGGLPFYSYRGPPAAGGGHFVSHAYWPLLPSGRVPLQAPPLLMDLDSLLQSVPPNKSVFDVLGPSGQSPHAPQGQYGLQSAPPLARYPQY
ncbi:forkhead box protein H1 isoform X2 [Conger conger]|nr:forkhead box protein H1 isoform X2 [Conger conger]